MEQTGAKIVEEACAAWWLPGELAEGIVHNFYLFFA
jgi:hypothetical protein